MIMSLCQSAQHSVLGLKTTATVDDDDDAAYRSPSPSPSPETESPLFTFPSAFSKKDPGGIGFIDDMGGGVDGLMSCTESLGFESSDERIDHHQIEDMDHAGTNCNRSSSKPRWRKDHHDHDRDRDRDRDDHEVVKKKFPPPISSINGNGQHSFFLRSVTSDGRLELTEVRIDKPEILRASREDGRLRLHLIRDYEDEQDDEETLEEEDDDEETLDEEEEEEEGRAGEWKLEGFRRCNEMMGHHDHHHHHHHHCHPCAWSQQCVPTR